MTSGPSFTPACSGNGDSGRSGIWSVRVLLAVSLISLILAQTAFKSTAHRDFCVGFAIGTLAVGLAASFMIKGVNFHDRGQPSDVDSISVTR